MCIFASIVGLVDLQRKHCNVKRKGDAAQFSAVQAPAQTPQPTHVLQSFQVLPPASNAAMAAFTLTNTLSTGSMNENRAHLSEGSQPEVVLAAAHV